MKMASYRGSNVLLSALRFLNNFVHQNDTTKASLIVAIPSGFTRATAAEGARETSTTLFRQLAQLTMGTASNSAVRTTGDNKTSAALSMTASIVLKSLVLNAECLQWAIKSGYVAKLLADVQRRLRSFSQTSKRDQIEIQTLCNLLGILTSAASLDEGRQVIYSSSETSLGYIFEDILTITSSEATSAEEVLKLGCLFIRNLSLSRVSKSYFAVWEGVMELLLRRLLDTASSSTNSTTTTTTIAGYLSCALWSIVFDNQKARTILVSRPPVLRKLEEMAAAARNSGTNSKLLFSLLFRNELHCCDIVDADATPFIPVNLLFVLLFSNKNRDERRDYREP